jgi:hypothetical protein
MVCKEKNCKVRKDVLQSHGKSYHRPACLQYDSDDEKDGGECDECSGKNKCERPEDLKDNDF